MGGKNIMSVELAIQRELAYRKKVASLFQLDEITKDLLPLQVTTKSIYMMVMPAYLVLTL